MATAAFDSPKSGSRQELVWLLPVSLMSVGTFVLAQLVGAPFGLSPASMLSLYAFKALRMLPTLLALAVLVQLFASVRERRDAPLGAFVGRLARLISDPWLLAARVAPLLLMPLMFVGFSSLKMLIPRFVPFWLDDSFAAMDRLLFLGHQPWELTHALFGSVPATMFIDRMYSLWVLLLSVAIVGFALFAPRVDRARFFMAFSLAWVVLGVGGAWLLASAGPCYSALIGATSAPEFAELMQRLGRFSVETQGAIDAPGWQQLLWRSHSTETYAFGMGISAMPSLHNAIATLYALAAFRMGRAIGLLMSFYALLIFIGSVHLGWHYAVDGIFGAGAMLLIWRWVDRWIARSGYAPSAPIAEPGPAATALGTSAQLIQT